MQIQNAIVKTPGKVRTGQRGEYVGALVRLESGEEVWVNANDPESHEGRTLRALGFGERVQVTATQKGSKTFYDLLTTAGDPGQADAFDGGDVPTDEEAGVRHRQPARQNGRQRGRQPEQPTAQQPARQPTAQQPAPAQTNGLGRGVAQEVAQIRQIAADVLNEVKAQGREIDPGHALTYAAAIWTKRQVTEAVEALLWQHEVPSDLKA